MHAVEVATLQHRQQPCGEQWRDGLGKPLAEPEVPHPQPRAGRSPGHRVGHGGHRPSLQQPQHACAIDGPFDVLCPTVAFGDPAGEVGYRLRLPGGQHPKIFPDRPGQGGRVPGDGPFLADRLTRHQPITQPGDGGNHDLIAIAGHRMGSERHPGRDRVDHHLHQDRHRGGTAAVPLLVGRDSIGASSGETPPHRLRQLFDGNVQIGLVQAGVGRVGQILGCARGPDREPGAAEFTQGVGERQFPPVSVQVGRRYDKTWWHWQPIRGQLTEDTGLAAHPGALGRTGIAKVEELGVSVHHFTS